MAQCMIDVNARNYRWLESRNKECQICDMRQDETVEHVVLECEKYDRKTMETMHVTLTEMGRKMNEVIERTLTEMGREMNEVIERTGREWMVLLLDK